jgi:hypothetical protein
MKRLILLAILIVTLPAVLAAAGPASAADDICACYDPPPPPPPPLPPPPPPPPPPPAPPSADETFAPGGSGGWSEETYTDGWGSLTGYRTGTDMTAPGGSGLTSVGTTLSAGCKVVRAWHTQQSLLGRTLYRFHQVKRFCWRYPHITFINTAIDITDVDNCCVRFEGLVEGASQNYYYTWKSVADGGHFSYRKGQVGNCILRWGCLATWYPWVTLWVNGNGAWKGEHGVA